MTSARWLLGLLLAMTIAVAGAQDESEIDGLIFAEQELSRELEQLEALIAGEREALMRISTSLPVRLITPVMLEDARLHLATLLSRQSGLQTRLKARRASLSQTLVRQKELRQAVQEDLDEEQRAALELELQALEQQIELLRQLESKLENLSGAVDVRIGLARQHLLTLQARFELPDLKELRKLTGPKIDALKKRVDRHLLKASRLRSEANALSLQDPGARSAARLLELRALAEEESAEFLQMDLSRLQADRLLVGLSMMAGNRAAPARVLEQAQGNLRRLSADFTAQQDLVANKVRQFEDQLAIVQQQASLQATQASSATRDSEVILKDLLKKAGAQQEELKEIQTRLRELQQAYARDLAASTRNELFLRASLPADAEGWQQLGMSLMTLPGRIVEAFVHALTNFWQGLVSAEPGLILFCLLIPGVLIALAYGIRKRFPAALVHSPLALLVRHLYALVPGLSLLFAAYLIQLRQRDLLLLLTPLLIYPVVRIGLNVVNSFLDEWTPGLNRRQTRLLLTETRWVLVLASVLAAMLVCAQTVALSPVVINLIDRLAMLCLLLLVVPLLHLRVLLMRGVDGAKPSRILRLGSLVLPLLLTACALTGLLGYVNLAYAVAERVGWFCLFAFALHMVHQLLLALGAWILGWIARRDIDAADFWQRYLIDPARRVALLLMTILAGQLLFAVYGWTAETPVVRVVPRLLEAQVFSVGDTPILLKTLLFGVLVILAAIWGGGWSRQVSYRWVFTRVDDQGLRNSLATFTQYFVVIGGVVIALKVIGLDLTALTVFAGALGVGIGFGMQQIVVNFISGILLLMERPLATTDHVAVDKFEGEVTRIGIRSLTVKTWDSQEVIIPNSAVITKPFTNWTRSDDIARTVLMVGISYEDDPEQAISLIKELLAQHPAVLDAPAFKVLLWEYGDSALMIRVQFFSRIRGDVGRADLRSQVLLGIWSRFKQAGITIPFPQRDVHVHQVRAGADALPGGE